MPTFEQFRLPDAGEGLTEADIVTWMIAPGDTVEVNQPIVEIETAKSLVELPCPFDGVVSRLLVQEGDTVEVGAPILEVDVDPDGEAPAEPAPESNSAPAEATAAAQAAPASAVVPVAETPASTESGSGAVLVGYGVKEGSATRRPRREERIEPVGGAEDLGEYPVLA